MDNPIAGQAYVWNEETRTWEPVKETPNKWIPNEKVRLYIFGILVALGPLVAFYGLATNEEIALWIGVGGTILGSPGAALAARNVPR